MADPSADAVARLSSMVAATTEPPLDEGELEALLVNARRRDAAGVAPDEDDWVETYDFNAAAAEGWRQKAGKVVPDYTFEIENERSDQAQVYRHCIEQASQYAALQSTHVRLA